MFIMRPRGLRIVDTSKTGYRTKSLAYLIKRGVEGIAAITTLLAAPALVAPAIGDDFFNVQPRPQDYYKYRYHSTYALPEQLLRTVENAHQRFGAEKVRAGRYESAYHEFVYVLGPFPNHPEALLALDEVCRKLKSTKCNMDSRFEKAITVNPEAAGTYVIQGIYLSRAGKNPAAIESYKRAIELQPESPVAHYNLGLAYVETKDYAHANEHAQKAYALGFPLPGLREKLKKAGQWKPLEAPTASAPAAGAEASSAKAPGEQPAAATGGEKTPTQ